MKGSITKFFGVALTGQGEKHVFEQLMDEAKEVVFIKGPLGFKTSELLKDIGYHFVQQGNDVEFFYDPLFENCVTATYVRREDRLYIQATTPLLEPVLYGTKHKVLSLYDCFDEEKLAQNGEEYTKHLTEADKWRVEMFSNVESALKLHDDWEEETRRYMDWDGLNEQNDQLLNDLFSDVNLNKSGAVTHRILGTLTPTGAQDTVPSITRNLSKRLFIKGYPGTGKSSLIKRLTDEAIKRGFDAQIVWCGLDSRSVDMVIIPELSFCIFDSTEPHKYFPEQGRAGDEIYDIAKFCHLTEVEENNIETISTQYRATMNKAIDCAKKYAESTKCARELIDDAVNVPEWRRYTAKLFE